MTGSRIDGVTGRTHRKRPTATRITTEEAYVSADAVIRRSPEFQAAISAARANPANNNRVFAVRLPIEDVLGPDYRNMVEGLHRVNGTETVRDVDFTNGNIRAVFELDVNGRPTLMTVYPEGN